MRRLNTWISVGTVVVLCLNFLTSCVSYIHETAEYRDIPTNLRSKSDILESYGKPLKVDSEDGLDVWYYLRRRDVAIPSPVQESSNAVLIFVIPMWWHTRYEDNLKFFLNDKFLMRASERKREVEIFYCGLSAVHMIPIFECGYL